MREAKENRLRKKQKYIEERQKILDKCKPAIDRISVASKLAEYFAAQVVIKTNPEIRKESELDKMTEELSEKASIDRFLKKKRKE